MPLSLGSKVLDFHLPGVDGKVHSLAEYEDRPVVAVTFWCNHCPYVQAWEQRVIEIQKDYNAKGVQVVAINSNETINYPTDDFPHMVERARDKRYPFPYLRDETQEVARKYLREALDALLAGKHPMLPETPPKGCSVKWAT